MGVRNGKRKTGKRRFVQTKRSRFSSKSLLNLSLSLDSARASPHPQRRRARRREREREKGETERFATRKKKVPRSFSRAVMVPRAFVPKREISNVVEHLKERRRMVEAGEKRTLSLTTTTTTTRTTHQKQDLRVFLPQPQRGEDVVKPIERPHVSKFCGATEAEVIFIIKKKGGRRKNFMCDTLNVRLCKKK